MNINKDNLTFMKSPVAEIVSALSLIGYYYSKKPNDQQEQLSPGVKEWVESITQKLPEDYRAEINIFFNGESFLGLTLFPFAVHHKALDDIHSFISMLHQLPLSDYYWAFTNSGFSPDLNVENYEDPKKIIELLENTNIPEEERWKITYLIFDGDRTKKRLIQLIERFYYQYFQEWEKEMLDLQKNFIHKINEDIEKKSFHYLKGLLDQQGIDIENESVLILPSYFSDRSTFYASIKRFGIKVFILGLQHYQTFESIRGEKDTLIAIKVLIDEKRFKILQLLKKQPYYGYELAQALDVSNSTMAHHLSTLVSHGFIRAIRVENKVYYETNGSEIQSVLKQLEKLFID